MASPMAAPPGATRKCRTTRRWPARWPSRPALRVSVVRPDDGQPDGRADPQQGHQDEQREEARRDLLPDAAVRLPRRDENEGDVAGAHDAGGERERDLGGAEVDAHAASRALLRIWTTTSPAIAHRPKMPKPRPQPPATSDQKCAWR